MRGALRSEWTKLYTHPWCVIGMIAAILITPIAVIVIGVNVLDKVSVTASELLGLCLRTLILGQIGTILVAACLCGQEYEQSSIRTTFLAIPARVRVLSAKIIIITVVTLLAGILSGLLSMLGGALYYGCNLTTQLTTEFLKDVIVALISWVFMAWISGALAVVTKSQITPLATLIPLVLGLSQMLFAISKLAKYLPDLAVMNLFVKPSVSEFLSAWQGLAVQCSWTILFMFTATLLTLRRDVR